MGMKGLVIASGISVTIFLTFFNIRSPHIFFNLFCHLLHLKIKISFSRTDKAGHPQWFVLGVGQVIKGLDIGMMDMCAGEKRKITVPSDLAFGKNGKGKAIYQFIDCIFLPKFIKDPLREK